ncbi:MAG TPA: hypothetical protein PLY66_03620 [Acidobacteriota bacterium]|nr:hypothetical protein [Acidobacteriota bacterium]HOT00073.1 hypothetical protein [Acidobacteriota bacterium]HQF85627.1 hypothetical protein [Acidobacteriota bacterium]HQG91129.1 hypothetical protein [Acidobacteriota bacterium]HQK86536.1 hypothetical protein [Acidobacteriota bacterium]
MTRLSRQRSERQRALSGWAVVGLGLILMAGSGRAESWEVLNEELRGPLTALTRSYFGPDANPSADAVAATAPSSHLWMVVVGFIGGIEPRDSSASGVVAIEKHLDVQLEPREDILYLAYNNLRWRRAADEVAAAVVTARADGRLWPGLRQPLIVAVGHSWGAGAIEGLAERLAQHGLDVSLAVFLDGFGWSRLQIPSSVRFAVNFYQRSGILGGFPLRGKSELVIQDPARTCNLGSFRIKPRADHWGWSWTLVQPLVYRWHHLLAHDYRVKGFLVDFVRLSHQVLARTVPGPPPVPDRLFERVVVLDSDEPAPPEVSPGVQLARRAGTPEAEIVSLAGPGTDGADCLERMAEIKALRPSLVVALELLDRRFPDPQEFSENQRRQVDRLVRHLTSTGAIVAVGLLPDADAGPSAPVNRYLRRIQGHYPNLLLVNRAQTAGPWSRDQDESATGRTIAPGPDRMAELLLGQLHAYCPERIPPGLTAAGSSSVATAPAAAAPAGTPER